MEEQGGILPVSIKNKEALYRAYMPFIENGGMFVPTNEKHQLGDELFILLSYLGVKDKTPISGKVVWITPRGVQGHQAGVGVQFSSVDKGATKSRIEKELAGIAADRPTETM